MPTITPTTGRVILFVPNYEMGLPNTVDAPLAAVVAAVNTDGTINLGVFDSNGNQFGATDVPIIELEVGKEVPVHGHFAFWMPYQLNSAAAAMEAKAAQVSSKL